MKITRITKIKHRIFRDFTWPAGLPDFARFNLIYGWNGSGKTTLSGLFTHLQSKQAITEGEVQFRIDDRLVNQADIPGAVLPQVRVFNRDTVKRSIFESAKESLPPVYYLGEDSADKQAQIEQLQHRHAELSLTKATTVQALSATERAFDTFCTDQARSIKNLLTAEGSEFNTYNAGKFKQNADAMSMAQPVARLSLTEINGHLATKASSVRETIDVPQANYPDFAALTKKVSALLEKSVVASTLDELANDPGLSSWMKAGLGLHRGEHSSNQCRFCEQPIPAGRLERLEAHFNDAFDRFQNDIADLLSEVRTSRQFVADLRVPDKGLLYDNLVNDYETATATLKQQSFLVIRFLDSLIAALEAKAANPFKKLDLHPFVANGSAEPSDSGWLLTLLEILVTAGSAISTHVGKQAFDRVCALIRTHNEYSAQFEQRQKEARRALEAEEVASAHESYTSQKNEIARLRIEAENLNVELSSIETRLQQLHIEIRQHYKAADELTRDMASYLGREELKFDAHDGGYTVTRNGHPALHLSEGERTAVSFIYFLKSLEDTSFDLKTGIVVVDDPVSSLDANSIYCAFGFMKSRLKDAGQLFILTHNFTFFRQVNNWLSHVKDNVEGQQRSRASQRYMLSSKIVDGHRTAEICALDPLLQNYQSEYHFLFKTVLNAASADSENMTNFYGMPNVARRLLEGVMSFKRPDKTGSLHQQVEGIKGFDEGKKARVIRFMHTYSHNEIVPEPEHDPSGLAEGPAILKDVLALIEHVDKEHYEKMVSMCD